MKLYRADLHIHTVLSPCAELEMGAPEIVEKCIHEGIDIIAITDHNAAANARAVAEAAEGKNLVVLPGMEVQSAEDIHIICLFGDSGNAMEFQEWVWRLLPPIKNRPESFGRQLIIDGDNNISAEAEVLLIQGIEATVDDIIHEARKLGGLGILAHIDREVYSYLAVLGMIPEGLEVDAVEISGRLGPDAARIWTERAGGRKVIRSSDAHRLEEIDCEKTTPLRLAEPSFDELLLALRSRDGREVLWPWD